MSDTPAHSDGHGGATGSHSHDHADGHSHGHGDTSTRKLALVAVINLLGFLAELAGGLLFGSVALLSDAVHMLFDALAYVMAFAASYVATRYDTSSRYSFGLHRLEPLSAFLNGALLLPMVGFILYESYQRFVDPVAIATGPTLAIAVGGLLVNLLSVYVIEGGEMSLNERGAFYHLLGDAGGSIAVIVSVLVIEYTGIRALDPITAGLIALVIVWSAGKLLRGSGAIFLHRTPLDVEAVREAIEGTDGVERVADLHAWQICSEITIATTHVETGDMADGGALTEEIHGILDANDVDHATVELCPAGGGHAHLTAHDH
jgi:cobalt-zinc-cadmium efflux system protein